MSLNKIKNKETKKTFKSIFTILENNRQEDQSLSINKDLATELNEHLTKLMTTISNLDKKTKKNTEQTLNENEEPEPKPKRKPTSYFNFMKEKRAEVGKKYPDYKVTQLSSVMGAMWKELSQEEKDKYKSE
jgi:hypothetical protein